MITAEQVKELRELTGAGMMECKKVLTEVDGDLAKAQDLLRERGIVKATKKAGRIAAEGLVESYKSQDNKDGVLVEVNIETDFAAKNPDFRKFVSDVAKHIEDNSPADVEELKAQKFEDVTVGEALTNLVAKIGENTTIRRFVKFAGEDTNYVESYIHGDGKIGVLVEFEAANMASIKDNEEFKTMAKDVAMHVAAAKPEYSSREEVPADVIEKEKEIIKAQAVNEGKPEAIAEKMVEGRINKFYKDVVITEQEFVKDPDVTVAKLIENVGAACGAQGLKFVRFARLERGEGIEKKEENFAEEVMKQING